MSHYFCCMKKVMVFGTFDVLHQGHLNFFEQAKKYGDYLIVVVARDATVQEVKKHKTTYTEQQRLLAVQNVPIVDLAVLGNTEDKYKIIEEHNPDIICLGYDQKAFTEKLQGELIKRKVSAKIIRLQSYKEDVFKSSKIKARMTIHP